VKKTTPIESYLRESARNSRNLALVRNRIRKVGGKNRKVQNFWRYESIGRKGNNEDTDNNSNNSVGVTAHGVRPDSGARTDARTGADQGHAGYSAGEREENESPGGSE
jgi:hypothetical protein